MRCYNLLDMERDRLLVRILQKYTNLEVCDRFYFVQPVFPYKSRGFIDDKDTGLWVVPYRDLVVRV